MEYREIFLTLLRKYDETKQPHSYLKDLVESTHLYLRMLERFCKGRKNLMVQVSSCTFFKDALFIYLFFKQFCFQSLVKMLMSCFDNSAEEEGEAEKAT